MLNVIDRLIKYTLITTSLVAKAINKGYGFFPTRDDIFK